MDNPTSSQDIGWWCGPSGWAANCHQPANYAFSMVQAIPRPLNKTCTSEFPTAAERPSALVYTTEEGGDWIKWNPGSREPAHKRQAFCVLFDNGWIWDFVCGWRFYKFHEITMPDGEIIRLYSDTDDLDRNG